MRTRVDESRRRRMAYSRFFVGAYFAPAAAGTASSQGRSPYIPARQCMDGIFYVMRTGCQWKALPKGFAASSTVHLRFQQWRADGVFERLWREGLIEYDVRHGLDWEWQAMDGAMTKAPLGGKRNRT